MKGIPAELMKRRISECDHDKWLQAQTRLSELREESFLLVVPIFRRLLQSLDAELNENAIASEQRLDRAGLPVGPARNGACIRICSVAPSGPRGM